MSSAEENEDVAMTYGNTRHLRLVRSSSCSCNVFEALYVLNTCSNDNKANDIHEYSSDIVTAIVVT